MGKRGPKPKRKKVTWTADLAYAVGLFAADGCLSPDGRHIDLTSKDIEQLENFMKCIERDVKIDQKKSGMADTVVSRIQFSDVTLYRFLQSIGFTPAKSKTMGAIDVPDVYFSDYLRGLHDGDGCFYSYWDPRWKNSFMYYLVFVSASKKHIDWLQEQLKRKIHVNGHITRTRSVLQLKYAKQESLLILQSMYYDKNVICLGRKRLKIKEALGIIGNHL